MNSLHFLLYVSKSQILYCMKLCSWSFKDLKLNPKTRIKIVNTLLLSSPWINVRLTNQTSTSDLLCYILFWKYYIYNIHTQCNMIIYLVSWRFKVPVLNEFSNYSKIPACTQEHTEMSKPSLFFEQVRSNYVKCYMYIISSVIISLPLPYFVHSMS